MVTGSKELIRDINTHLVLETVLNEGPVSRAAIAAKLGLTKATVSAIVAGLLEEQMVREIESEPASIGRRPILLEFCRENGRILSIDLGVNTIVAFTSDLTGNDCGLQQYRNTYTRDTVIKGLAGIIKKTMNRLEKTPFGVVGICIGIHGTVHENEITFAPYYDYAHLPFAKELSEKFGVPVYLENEANLSVVGEKSFCFHAKDLIGISVHSGIGVGIIADGTLYTGAKGNAGEFGHTIVEARGRQCPCGNQGCLEQYASERAILQDYAKAVGAKSVSIDRLIADYNANDPVALTMLDRFVRYIAVGINNLVNTFDPEIVVINSGFTIYIPDLTERIFAELKNRMNDCRIVPSGLQDTSILLGGVCVCIHHFLGVDYLSPNNPLTVG
ncbi:MAG: ROK family transcriptional regulator [Lachnospiraceae bacterium]|nr:ROK family transcriptional regulator [Lachnospiraceae bacterium]